MVLKEGRARPQAGLERDWPAKRTGDIPKRKLQKILPFLFIMIHYHVKKKKTINLFAFYFSMVL